MPNRPRKKLEHAVPDWVDDGAVFFLTLCLATRGTTGLCRGNIASHVLDAAKFYHDRQRWYLHLFLLMPDHLHALVSFPPDGTMASTVGQWKGFLAKTQNIAWQDGFWDHRLRTDESLEEKATYILQNPVRAGLVDRIEAWPHWWRPDL